jgi:hypothetical protein
VPFFGNAQSDAVQAIERSSGVALFALDRYGGDGAFDGLRFSPTWSCAPFALLPDMMCAVDGLRRPHFYGQDRVDLLLWRVKAKGTLP